MSRATPSKHLVLYADDDRDDIALVQEAFTATTSDIELVVASDGTEALSYLQNLSPLDPDPCLIILDINMPKMDGKEALSRIRKMQRFENVPVVLFTTSSMPLDKNFAEKYNAGFITKPLNTQQMKEITDKFLDHCSPHVRSLTRKNF